MNRRLLICLLLTLAVIMAVRDASLVTWDDLDAHSSRVDYIGIRLCITMAAEGSAAAARLYDLDLEAPAEAQIMGPVHFADGILPCDYPSYTALLASPLYYLSPANGFLVWDALEIAALLLALWLLGAMLPRHYRYWLWLGALAFLPIYHSLVQGQTSPALLLGITLLWRGLRAGGAANWWAGAGLGLCLLKPQFLPLFILYLLYKRNWRALGGFSLVAGFAYLGGAALSGFDWPIPYLKLLAFLATQNGHYGFYPELMFNWRGLLARFGWDNSLALLLLTGLTVAALIYAWWRTDVQNRSFVATPLTAPDAVPVGALELQLAATAIATILTSFHLYSHDLTVLLFSGAVLLGWAAQRQFPTWLTALLLSGVLVTDLTFGTSFDVLIIVMMIIACAATLYLLQSHSSLRAIMQ
jgi:hypothetical protein